MQTDVAIIHSGKDREIAARMASFLKRQGINVWIDPEPLVLGHTPEESVAAAAKSTNIILYLVSRAILERAWVQSESMALHNEMLYRSNLRVIPVLIDNCELPPMLSAIRGFDLRTGDLKERLRQLADELRILIAKRAVFICHSSRDKPAIRPIVKQLRRRPRLALWYDDDSLLPGSVIRRGIETGISRADYLIAVLSNNAIDTIEGWIGFELDQAYEKERERNKRGHYFVIPVLIESGIAVPGWLSTKVYVDLTKNLDEGIRAIVKAVSVAPPLE